MFYNPVETLSHNCLINQVLSERGGGKTFGSIEYALKQFKKKKAEFIYIRRTDEELKKCKDNLFAAIITERKFPKDSLTVDGYNLKVNGKIAGYCIPLSKAYQLKSTAYPNVELMIFDEYLIEERAGRYLPSEVHKLLALYETVARLRDVKLLMLANYISRSNIYFDYWRMYPKNGAVFTKHPDKSILIHMWSSQEYREKKAITPFAKIIADTPYGGYILENKALNDNFTFVKSPSGKVRYLYTIKFSGLDMGFWYSDKEGRIYVRDVIEENCKTVFAFDTNVHAPNILLLRGARQDSNIKTLKYALENGLVYFENLSLKNATIDLLNFI